MAIYSAVPPPPEYANNNPPATPLANQSATGIDIDAWTISALQSLSVSPVARGTGTPLAIPIDHDEQSHLQSTATRTVSFNEAAVRTETPRRPPSRRDSLKKRDALIKGKEGSRQRRRWENSHLMGVPNAQPPSPVDWEVHPTHPTHRVPYQVAQFWDRGVRQMVEDKTTRLAAQRKKQQLATGSATGLGKGEVPRDLRESAKRSPVVKSWVRALEEPVRQFLHSRAEEGAEVGEEGLDSEDEEIVFVGRRGAAAEGGPRGGWKMAHREVEKETVDQGMVFDSFGDDEGAAYKRWLTHAISDYYGLESSSVMMANPKRKVVYVRIKQVHGRSAMPMRQFPRPLWELC